jgi:L-aminopeptidase/D-esterase-like protein
MGYAACQAARAGPILEGSVGAGTGCTVGKILGPEQASKGGLGTASVDLGSGLQVGAIVAVNVLGDVVDPTTGEILAGAHAPDGDYFVGTLEIMKAMTSMQFAQPNQTTVGVVATNAKLTKEEANKVADMAHDGLARAVRPAHTMFDGDTLFALATGEIAGDVNLVGAYAAEVMAEAIARAVKMAKSE